MTCEACGSNDWIVVDDNGATYPETRVECCECQHCGYEFRQVLTA